MTETIFAPNSPEYEAFFEAVSAGELEKVKVALTPSIDINALVGDGWEGETALHIASTAGDLDMIEFLIASGASPNAHDRSPHGPSTPLHDAAFSGRSRAVEILLDHGANIHAIGEQGGMALLQVLRNEFEVESKHIETIKVLLDQGQDINSVALDLGGTVLHQAAKLGSVELVQFLLDRGANINPDPESSSIIGTAARHERYGVVNFLIKHGVKVDGAALAGASSISMFNLLIPYADNTTISQSGALHAACGKAISIDLITLMLDKGFDIDPIDHHGNTPLLYACGLSHVSPGVVELLLSRGAAVTARNAKAYTGDMVKGDTPLHRAAWRSDPKVVELLLKAGADLTSRNDKGQTPLIKFASRMDAISSRSLNYQDMGPRLQVLKMLIDAGADVNAVDGKHRSALHALALCGENHCKAPQRAEAVDLLVKAGIAIEVIDSDGRSALDIFSTQKDHQMVELLSRYLPGTSKPVV